MSRTVIGLDLSLTETGICTPEGTFHMKTPASKIKGWERVNKIRGFVFDHIYKHDNPLVMVEGYSFGSKGRAVFDIGELGGVIKYALWLEDTPYIDVPPSTLKMFATGKGNSGKMEVVVQARDRLGYDGTNDNEADARWLRELGLHLQGEGTVELPKTHLRALEKIQE